MIRELLLIALILATVAGCASAPGILNPENMGRAQWGGGELQLLFANPEYDTTDPMIRQDLEQREIFGKKGGFPAVTGGIGLMEVWRF